MLTRLLCQWNIAKENCTMIMFSRCVDTSLQLQGMTHLMIATNPPPPTNQPPSQPLPRPLPTLARVEASPV